MDGTPSLEEALAQIESMRVAMNMVWVLVCAFLVMSMQAGFALVETGLARAKNAGHTMGMNFLVYPIGILGFWALGFGIEMGGIGPLAAFGGDATLSSEATVHIAGKPFGLFGMKGFFMQPHVFTPAVATFFLFQLMFMVTTATIPTGALAERWKFSAFVAFSFFVAALIYPVYGNWTWGGGFLAQLGTSFGLGHGHVDFAGSSVVHMTGGVIALVTAKMIGPRIGKFAKDGTPRAIPGHNLPMVMHGTFVLALGWFGFNAGSTLMATDARIAVVAVNTMLASASGAFVSYLHTRYRFGVPDLSMMCNGMLAGMVAITAPCAFVGASTSILIGVIAGVLVVEATLFVERKLKIDDCVGAFSVHGVNGTFGVLCVGIFADGRYGDGINGVAGGVRGILAGDPGQLAASAIAIVVNLLWVVPTTIVCFKVVEHFIGNRVDAEAEIQGLDVPEFGAPGYAGEGGDYEGPLSDHEEITAPRELAAPAE